MARKEVSIRGTLRLVPTDINPDGRSFTAVCALCMRRSAPGYAVRFVPDGTSKVNYIGFLCDSCGPVIVRDCTQS